MKRHMDLIHKILRQVEQEPLGTSIDIRCLEGYSCRQIQYHIELALEAGYLCAQKGEGNCNDQYGHYPIMLIQRLTWKGHELLNPTKGVV